MLVLSRKENQSFMIGEDIEVYILDSKDGVVKIGIDAPKEVKIYRKEIYDEIKKENVEALDVDINMFRKVIKGSK